MTELQPRLPALAFAALLGGCAPRAGYVVGIYDVNETASQGALEKHAEQFGDAVEEAGGSMAVFGLEAGRELPNPAAETLDAMPRGRIFVAEFDSRRAARRFSRGERPRRRG